MSEFVSESWPKNTHFSQFWPIAVEPRDSRNSLIDRALLDFVGNRERD